MGASAILFEGLSDPKVLEAMAVQEGVNLVKDLKLVKFKLASDCISVVKAMTHENLGLIEKSIRFSRLCLYLKCS
jgi:hypothetical protein